MTSGLLTLILLAATPTPEAAGGLDELVAALAPESDGRAELHFTEERASDLLDEPLVVEGRLWRNERGQLVRETTEPRRETQKLSASMVVIERPGRSPRNFSISHAPELAVLHQALTTLLAGDAEGLRKHFEHELVRGDSGWRLRLKPRDPELAERVESLSLAGSGEELQRLELSLTDGETVITRLSPGP